MNHCQAESMIRALAELLPAEDPNATIKVRVYQVYLGALQKETGSRLLDYAVLSYTWTV